MTAAPQVRVSPYLLFVEFMEKAGLSAERELEKSLLPSIAYRDPETLVPIHLAHDLLERGARALGLPDFGFVVGQQARVESLGVFGKTLRRALTLHDALGKMRMMFALYSSGERIWWRCGQHRVFFYHTYTTESGIGKRFAQQCILLLMRDFVRLAAGPTWQPDEVLWAGPSSDIPTMCLVFDGARICRSELSAMVFPEELLSRSLAQFPSGISRSDESEMAAFEATAPSDDFVGSIQQVISTLMGHGQCQLGEIANAIGMHPRTLQRRLAVYDEDYSDILSQVRFETALRLMRDPDLRMVEIAFELGYTDPSNFTRAFRGWTGLTPKDFRRLRIDRDDSPAGRPDSLALDPVAK
jgi:AraC-like DNA-binding protein